MKFINYLEKITGVDVFALLSLTIFFTFFVLMAIWVATADQRLMDDINHLPLDN